MLSALSSAALPLFRRFPNVEDAGRSKQHATLFISNSLARKKHAIGIYDYTSSNPLVKGPMVIPCPFVRNAQSELVIGINRQTFLHIKVSVNEWYILCSAFRNYVVLSCRRSKPRRSDNYRLARFVFEVVSEAEVTSADEYMSQKHRYPYMVVRHFVPCCLLVIMPVMLKPNGFIGYSVPVSRLRIVLYQIASGQSAISGESRRASRRGRRGGRSRSRRTSPPVRRGTRVRPRPSLRQASRQSR